MIFKESDFAVMDRRRSLDDLELVFETVKRDGRIGVFVVPDDELEKPEVVAEEPVENPSSFVKRFFGG